MDILVQAHKGVLHKMCIAALDPSSDGEEEAPRGESSEPQYGGPEGSRPQIEIILVKKVTIELNKCSSSCSDGEVSC